MRKDDMDYGHGLMGTTQLTQPRMHARGPVFAGQGLSRCTLQTCLCALTATSWLP